MEVVEVTGVEKTYPVMKSITQSALKAGITHEEYDDYQNCLCREGRATKEVLTNNER
ncbi:MAG: hypothetical protein IKE91_03175 [Clostridia bacterium]|nr:hypothetical protein [Clostridia bacterium]